MEIYDFVLKFNNIGFVSPARRYEADSCTSGGKSN